MARTTLSGSVFLYLVLGLLLPSVSAVAQGNPQSPQAEKQQDNPASDESSSGVILPAPLGGLVPPLTTHGESPGERVNLLTGSLGVSGLYTDNAFSSGGKSIDDYQYQITPGIGLQSFGQHTQWMLNYAGGVTIDQRAPGNSQQTHVAAADLIHQFTHRLSSEFRQDFNMTNNPFDQLGASESLPTVSGPGQLSNFAVPAPITRIGSVSTASATYQLSQYSGVGVSGSFSLLQFQDDAALAGAGGTLVNTTNAAGRTFYLHQISPHHTIGAEYQLQALRFNGGVARALDQAIYLFDGIGLGHNMTLSLYAGPDRTYIRNVIVPLPGLPAAVFPTVSTQWSAVGGIAFAWRTRRNGLRLSGDRQITDGSAWAGAVRLNTARMELTRAFGRRWTSNLSLAYSDGRILGVPVSFVDSQITTEEGAVGFKYGITRDFSATAEYARIQQPHTGAFTGIIRGNYNQVQVGFVYQFQKAIFK
jgi:hypothetical protein